MRAETYPMQSMRTSYNGYDFRIKTFSSDTLRKIHLWMLESHLEQAIGMVLCKLLDLLNKLSRRLQFVRLCDIFCIPMIC